MGDARAVRHATLALVLAACGGEASTDVTGPYTGTTHRFVVDAVTLPRDATAALVVVADLDGDGTVEDQLGAITGLLAVANDLSVDAASMIAAGGLASTVEITADDLADDPSVAVAYLGADGDPATAAGGALIDGGFRSNRTATTRVPGIARLRLPVFTNSDPLLLPLDGMELELTPDGRGGYDGVVRGGIAQAAARAAAYAGLRQMFATEPDRHQVFVRGVDLDRDGAMSDAELDASIIATLVTADVQLFVDGRYAPRAVGARPDSVSVALAIHLSPCADGRCATAPPAETCRDRVRDGDETDVDCGGGCQPCAGGLACVGGHDCQALACTADRCAAPSCADGLRDGFESDVDCGGPCPACAVGDRCVDDGDCAGVCAGGRCAPP